MLEKTGAPAPRQYCPGKEKPRQIQYLPQVIIVAQFAYGISQNLLGIICRQAFRAADAQVFVLVDREGGYDGALAQFGFEQQLFFRVAFEIGFDADAQTGIADIEQPSQIQGRVAPGTLGDQLDDAGKVAAPFHQQHIAGA